MYSYSLTATMNIEHPIVKEENLTRQQMVDRMQAMRAMTRKDEQTYIMTISYEPENGKIVSCNIWSYILYHGIEWHKRF